MNDAIKKDVYYPKLTEFGSWVEKKIHMLTTGGRALSGVKHQGYLQNDPYAVAAIAKLRRSIGHDVGADPDIFEWTLQGIPQEQGKTYGVENTDASVTRHERVAHAVLTLFAEHQHSIRTDSMHTDINVSLGNAVGQLLYGNPNEAGVRNLMNKLQTANSPKEMVRHARRLIALLKRERIALNYAVLAQDMIQLELGREQANKVRLRWGRDMNNSYARQQQNDDKNNKNNNNNNSTTTKE